MACFLLVNSRLSIGSTGGLLSVLRLTCKALPSRNLISVNRKRGVTGATPLSSSIFDNVDHGEISLIDDEVYS